MVGVDVCMYVLQRTYAEVPISLFLLDRKLGSTLKDKGQTAKSEKRQVHGSCIVDRSK